MAGCVVPAYGTGSLAEVVPSALSAIGADGWVNRLSLPPAASYVVLLVDGLGWNLLRRNPPHAPYLSSLAEHGGRPITSGVPSTTATSLTSFGTGLPPGTHGVVGYTSRVPGTMRLLDALKWDAKVDPHEWQPNPPAFEIAASKGVSVTVVSRRMFENSGLTRAGQRGARFVGADYQGERLVETVAAASVPGSLVYLYAGELDSTGHRHGCESAAWKWELESVDHFAETLRSQLAPETSLVVVADHGMVDIPFPARLDVDDEPDLLTDVAVFGGEARFRHLYCNAAETDVLASRWRERMGQAAIVKTRDEAIEAGWFGSVSASVRPRLGDVMVASIAKTAVVSRSRFPHEAKLFGLHGSLTVDEMLVPLLVDPAT